MVEGHRYGQDQSALEEPLGLASVGFGCMNEGSRWTIHILLQILALYNFLTGRLPSSRISDFVRLRVLAHL